MSDELKLCLIIGAVVLTLILIVAIIIIKKRSGKEIREFPGLLEALGGNENVSNITLNGSRISMNFENKNSINKELIKENGVETIVVSNKKITLVIGKNAPDIYKYLQEINNK